MWEGVLHIVPPPSYVHQKLGSELLVALDGFADAEGLSILYEVGVCRVIVTTASRTSSAAAPNQVSERGVSGGQKWCSSSDRQTMGVREVFVIDPATSQIELFLFRGGKLLPAVADGSGVLRSEVLGVGLQRETSSCW
jgi:hypothetical protein